MHATLCPRGGQVDGLQMHQGSLVGGQRCGRKGGLVSEGIIEGGY